jgi:hypothetical protein
VPPEGRPCLHVRLGIGGTCLREVGPDERKPLIIEFLIGCLQALLPLGRRAQRHNPSDQGVELREELEDARPPVHTMKENGRSPVVCFRGQALCLYIVEGAFDRLEEDLVAKSGSRTGMSIESQASEEPETLWMYPDPVSKSRHSPSRSGSLPIQ